MRGGKILIANLFLLNSTEILPQTSHSNLSYIKSFLVSHFKLHVKKQTNNKKQKQKKEKKKNRNLTWMEWKFSWTKSSDWQLYWNIHPLFSNCNSNQSNRHGNQWISTNNFCIHVPLLENETRISCQHKNKNSNTAAVLWT